MFCVLFDINSFTAKKRKKKKKKKARSETRWTSIKSVDSKIKVSGSTRILSF